MLGDAAGWGGEDRNVSYSRSFRGMYAVVGYLEGLADV